MLKWFTPRLLHGSALKQPAFILSWLKFYHSLIMNKKNKGFEIISRPTFFTVYVLAIGIDVGSKLFVSPFVLLSVETQGAHIHLKSCMKLKKLHAFFISNTFTSNARLKLAQFKNLSRKILRTELWNLCQMIALFPTGILNTFFQVG